MVGSTKGNIMADKSKKTEKSRKSEKPSKKDVRKQVQRDLERKLEKAKKELVAQKASARAAAKKAKAEAKKEIEKATKAAAEAQKSAIKQAKRTARGKSTEATAIVHQAKARVETTKAKIAAVAVSTPDRAPSVAALRAKAREQGIVGYSRLNKEQLLARVK
jgi:colicin import membrane protein